MLKCCDCGKEFSEEYLHEIKTSYEAENGVSHLFSNSTPVTINVCPYCHSRDYEEVYEVYEEDEET